MAWMGGALGGEWIHIYVWWIPLLSTWNYLNIVVSCFFVFLSATEWESHVPTAWLSHQSLNPLGSMGPVQCDREQGPSFGNGVEKPVQGRRVVQNRPIWWLTVCLRPQVGQELQGEANSTPFSSISLFCGLKVRHNLAWILVFSLRSHRTSLHLRFLIQEKGFIELSGN